MNRLKDASSLKRQRAESNSLLQSLTDNDCAVLNVIRSKGDTGIEAKNIAREANIQLKVVSKSIFCSLSEFCLKIIKKLKVATAEGVYDFFKKNKITKEELALQQITEILSSLVLDNKLIEVKSTGMREYHSIPFGTICYRCPTVMELDHGPKIGAMASIPCGVCPRISQCTPDGVISPATCVYFTKWLDF